MGGYDSALLPIEPDALKRQLEQGSRDSVGLFQLVRRAAVQNQWDVALQTLSELRASQPHNANVLAVYRLLFDLADASPNPPNFKPTPEQIAASYSALEQAYKIDPKLWATYAVEGSYLSNIPGSSQKSIDLLKKAVELAPDVSIPHYLLSVSYLTYDLSTLSPENGLVEAKKASQLQPVISKGPYLLMWCYIYSQPDKELAATAKKQFLATIPPGHPIGPITQSILSQVN